jgi:ribose transport system permease protein
MTDPQSPSARTLRALTGPAARSVVALLLVLTLGSIFHHRGVFFQASTHRDSLRMTSEFGILACGMALVIISGGIDLAVGSVLALVAVLFSLMTIRWGWSPWLAVPACLLAGAACGGASGALIAGFRLQPFIATLAMMVFVRGLAKSLSGGEQITATKDLPEPAIFNGITSYVLGEKVSIVTIIFVVCVAISWLMLSRHRWGRELCAVGGNEDAARLSGVSVGWVKWLAYVMSGLFAGVAGICHAAQTHQGNPSAGDGYELKAIAMVVIGGTSLSGGRGGIGLTLLGILTYGYLDKILSINAVPDAAREMLTGLIIVLAVLAQRQRR